MRTSIAGLMAISVGPTQATVEAAPCARPAQTSITIDGEIGDWSEVLTNPANTSRDGNGSSSPCPADDRDCPFGGARHDLCLFAWTWDAVNFYFLEQRHGGGDGFVFVYLDTDFDGLMEDDEPLLKVQRKASWPDSRMSLIGYSSQAATGDALVDGTGLADGYKLRGEPSGGFGTLVDDLGSTPDQASFEGAIPRALLGVAPGAPLNFHVTTSPDNSPPAFVRDNMGGSAGGIGTTAFDCVELSPELSTSAAPGQALRLPHRAQNLGNLPRTLVVAARSSSGLDVEFHRDLDLDGFAETLLGYDAGGGDGLFTLPGDSLTAAGDPNGDGRLDTGPLAALEWADIELAQVYPPGSSGLVEALDVEVELQSAPSVADAVTDLVRVGTVTLRDDETRLAAAGDRAWFPHVVQNNSDQDLRVDLDAVSARGWSYQFWEDPDSDGDPDDALPLLDTDASGLTDLFVPAQETRSILALLSVPPNEPVGGTEFGIVRASLAGIPEAWVSDSLVVAEPVTLAPDHLLQDDDARYGASGGTVYFAHRLTHALSRSEVYELTASSDQGWATQLLTDPDGDGRPYDSQPLAGATVQVAANGGQSPFLVRVSIPAGTPVDELSRILVTATAQSAPSVAAQADDDAVAAIVRVYEDAGHVLNIARAAPCSTVYGQASGLVPSSPDYRFVWRDGAGATLRVQDVATDALGDCADERSLAPTDLGPDFSLEIEWFDGLSWLPQDAADFAVGDAVTLSELMLESPTAVHLQDASLSVAVTVLNESFNQDASDLELRWVVTDPSAGTLLDEASGTFVPCTGTEATRRESLSLGPRERRELRLAVAPVTHPVTGTYRVELFQASGCWAGAEVQAGTITYEVVDDEDLDGLTRAEEVSAGTDPTDADSDDDGALDGEDGVLDFDGDGSIDALDCDSDGDGLFDGTEMGIWSPHADTDLGAGCFVADSWPPSTTDPDLADTDGGGVPDGVEDSDGDVQRDPGELDPNDPSDDAGACAPDLPPEVTGLRVSRQGEAARLTWDAIAPEPCTSYVVLATEVLPLMPDLATGLPQELFADSSALVLASVRYYLVVAESAVSGRGPSGR